MKGKGRFALMLVVCGALVAPTLADYNSIQHNLFNGVDDTDFDGVTGEFSIHATTSDTLTLNDPIPLVGVPTGTVIDIVTNFDSITPAGLAKFTGGTLSLTFNFDMGGGPVAHEISGPIDLMLFEISPMGTLWRIDGLGDWSATTVNLPGSNNWPVNDLSNPRPGFSGIDSLSIVFDDDLSAFNWDRAITGRVESLYSIFPHAATPEPASLTLLALGVFAVARKRR